MKMKIKVAIIDDEQYSVESLFLHIQKLFPQFEVVLKSTKPTQAISEINKLKPDLLFLDVEMPMMNGFEFLEKFEELSFDVIFITAYSQYAVQAFKARAINYLLKPIDENELQEAVDNWLTKKASNDSNEEVEKLLEHLKKEGILKNKIAVPITDGMEFIEVTKIIYCKSQNNYTFIHLENGKEVLISKTLKEVEKVLENFLFVRVHQSYLINPNYMQKYLKNDGGYVVMNNGQHIPISNSKKKLITELFDTIKK